MASGMRQNRLEFIEPGQVRITDSPAPLPSVGQVLVQTDYSAISPGTEMLVYRGQWPPGVRLDSTIKALAKDFTYPLSYGYSAVGRVIALGEAISDDWLGRRVFAFQPHQNLFCAELGTLEPIPDDVDEETALFLPSMETAVNLLLDGRPLIGERVLVFGQGIVGLLSTALLTRFPLARLVTIDAYPKRRDASRGLGAAESYDPNDPDVSRALMGVDGQGGEADLIFELSGQPGSPVCGAITYPFQRPGCNRLLVRH